MSSDRTQSSLSIKRDLQSRGEAQTLSRRLKMNGRSMEEQCRLVGLSPHRGIVRLYISKTCLRVEGRDYAQMPWRRIQVPIFTSILLGSRESHASLRRCQQLRVGT